uniref:Uncharacterized protein n=1 Tax=Rhizophora mucronata TaxID=61149 RepID=A0A2P2PPB6_RHIMU
MLLDFMPSCYLFMSASSISIPLVGSFLSFLFNDDQVGCVHP